MDPTRPAARGAEAVSSGAAPRATATPDATPGATAGAEPASAAADAVLAPPGEMAARSRALDWAATSLGPAAGWLPALRADVRLMLGAPVPTSR